jgi:ankyrin repeat protein
VNRLILCFLVFSFSQVHGASLSESFPAGKGANYNVKMKQDATPIHLSLYVSNTRVDSVNIEYFMETKGILPVQMWQQFEIGINPDGAQIRKGYVMTKELEQPESMPPEYLKGASGGIQVNDFLFANKAQLDKDKVGEEIVEIAAGTTKATHYRVTNNGQTVDYWISDDAKPMGLVMLVSKSEKSANQNYSLELVSLMDNVKAKIQPEKAVPLTDKGKAFLAKPESLR